jgi:S1-C subfamily serine protease
VVSGGGTGIVVDSDKGYVLTNDHVVAGATSVKARLETGEEVNARVLGNAPCEDLAVIQLNPRPRGLESATLGRSSELAAGDKVIALGFPGAFEEDITQRKLQATEGTINSKPGPATLGDNLPKLPSVIQHQAPLNHGNSGGPLFNDGGEVVGVNTLAASGDSQNQNGAIAIDRARSLLPALERGQDKGYVGWSIQNIADLNNELYVISVDANSPADRAELVFGDRVDELDNTAVKNVPEVCDILGSKAAGDRLKVAGVVLDGRSYTTTVRLK